MQQFIRYLYEYEGEKRVRNVGFVKVEKEERACTIQIRAKGLATTKGQKVEVLVFYRKGKDYVQVSQGKIECENATSHLILRFEAEDMGGTEAYANLHGVLLRSENGHIYGSIWDDSVIPLSRMWTQEEWDRQQNTRENAKAEVEEESEAKENAVEEQAEETEEEREGTVVKTEETVMESEGMSEVQKEVPGRLYEKICRKDLVRLPRKEWRLANNSFLLHGFYNYHHLLYIEEGENCWIGVPGIFHEKEQAAARAFGFPQFHRITEGTLELSDQEYNLTEDFGYWCRAVTKGQ